MPSKIEWTDEVLNPIAGCTKCSPGCLNCYAERMAIRLNGIFAAKGDDDNWAKMSNVLKWDYSKPELYEFGKATGWNEEVELFTNRLDKPLHWRKPRRIFICSMSDLFHPKVPFEFIDEVFATIALCPQHTGLILTKRIERMKEYFTKERMINWKDGTSNIINEGLFPLANVQLGVSMSNQAEADEKIPILLQIPAAVRWLSIEPLLGEIDLTRIGGDKFGWGRMDILNGLRYMRANALEEGSEWETKPCDKVDWVVVGCESGPKRRGCNIRWVRSIVDQCKAASVPCFVKQINKEGKVVKMPKGFPQEYPGKEFKQLPERK